MRNTESTEPQGASSLQIAVATLVQVVAEWQALSHWTGQTPDASKTLWGRSMIPIDIERRFILQMQYRGRVKSIALDAVVERQRASMGWIVGV
jgi:hypothetical protein